MATYTPLSSDETKSWDDFDNKYDRETQCAMLRRPYGSIEEFLPNSHLANLASLWGEDASGRPLRGLDTIQAACGHNVRAPLNFTPAMDLSQTDSVDMCHQQALLPTGCRLNPNEKNVNTEGANNYPRHIAKSPMKCFSEVFLACASATEMGDTGASLAQIPEKAVRRRGVSTAY